MKKIIIAALVFVPAMFLTSCRVNEAAYYPGYYNSDYVYSVGYYGYRPYWGGYSGGWGNAGYWSGYRAYNRGWVGRGWGWGGRGWGGHGWARGWGHHR
ncbi:hypothetical protein [Legionella fairfieldensis]|uniref:hypothetical protein n=1 Tax=Legionella fairfieldensis TaxID=45064 RepID=UPI00056919D8|nr:hypothetical protein [Legionella fairfieldensis]